MMDLREVTETTMLTDPRSMLPSIDGNSDGRLLRVLQILQSFKENGVCFDCLLRGPSWTSWSLGIFLCFRCAALHRGLGVHISRVKSVSLDRWTPQQVARLVQIGNKSARAIYESRLPSNFHRPTETNELKAFIQIKYLHRVYVTPGYRDQPLPPSDLKIEQLERIFAEEFPQVAPFIAADPSMDLKPLVTSIITVDDDDLIRLSPSNSGDESIVTTEESILQTTLDLFDEVNDHKNATSDICSNDEKGDCLHHHHHHHHRNEAKDFPDHSLEIDFFLANVDDDYALIDL